MRSRIRTLLVGLALSGAGAEAALAACEQADLAGTLDFYVINNDAIDINDDGVVDEIIASWTVCLLQVGADGVIQAGTSCINATGERSTIDGGELVLQASCLAEGQLFLQGAEQANQLPRATLTVDKGLLVGIGRSPDGTPFVFQAVKRRPESPSR